jgi:hypothetical protein
MIKTKRDDPMKQVILQVIPPKPQLGGIPHKANNGLKSISGIAKELCQHDARIQQLGEYTWLIPLDTHLPTLCRLIVEADNANLSYRTSYLENELKWDVFNPYPE